MKTTDNGKTTVRTIDKENTFKGVTQLSEGYSLKGTTHLDEIIFMDDMFLIKGITTYKENSLFEGTPLTGKTLISEIAIVDGKIFLKGITYIYDDQPQEGTTLLKLSGFNKSYPLDVHDLFKCLK
jgi:hypothetical protein